MNLPALKGYTYPLGVWFWSSQVVSPKSPRLLYLFFLIQNQIDALAHNCGYCFAVLFTIRLKSFACFLVNSCFYFKQLGVF